MVRFLFRETQLILTIGGVVVTIYKLQTISRDGAVAARMAHNHEVPGSSPGPATKNKTPAKSGVLFLVTRP